MKATAPGKLFLLGEYAVLEGGPALLVPVARRASVTLGESEGAVTSITSETVTLTHRKAVSRFPLLDSVQRTLNTPLLQERTLTLDTSAFFLDGQKLGLGSSAALTVALVRACGPDDSVKEIYRRAQASHQHFQGGLGSGADIALAVMDQPIRFARGETPQPLSLPGDLHMLAIWTGQSASTTELVGAMRDFKNSDPTRYRQHMEGLINTATACAEAVSDQDTGQILAGIEQYDRQLFRLSSESRVNFYNQLHLDMRNRVKLTYKPSGAGGGDFGIACSTDKNELIALAEKLEREQTCSFLL